jgi:hypothetical protein
VIARHPQLACIIIILFILCAPSISFAANGSAEAKKIARIIEGQQRQPLILFVAKGAPNACGTGCSEWIAAEGKIDPSSSRGLKNFLPPCRGATFRFSLTRTAAVPALLRRSARRCANIE